MKNRTKSFISHSEQFRSLNLTSIVSILGLLILNGSQIPNLSILIIDGLDSRDSTFILSVENDTASEGEIKVTALFQPEGYPSSSFTVTFKNGLLDLGVMVPSEYAQNGTGRGLLGKRFLSTKALWLSCSGLVTGRFRVRSQLMR